MAITFDPANKVIMLDVFNASASTIWSRWVDWLVLSDNIKYPPAFSQVGGVAPIALYLILENGWRVRPQEASGITTITGNLLTAESDSPITQTLGTFNVQVNLETPIAAQAILVNTGTVPALTAGESALLGQITELRKRMDLDPTVPNTYANDASTISNADFTLTRTDNGDGTSTVQRS